MHFFGFLKDYSLFNVKNSLFYNGTPTALKIDQIILSAVSTEILSEERGSKIIDKVFLTNSLRSAKQYARKAITKFGGIPIVYIANPIGDLWKIGPTELVVDIAKKFLLWKNKILYLANDFFEIFWILNVVFCAWAVGIPPPK